MFRGKEGWGAGAAQPHVVRHTAAHTQNTHPCTRELFGTSEVESSDGAQEVLPWCFPGCWSSMVPVIKMGLFLPLLLRGARSAVWGLF